MNIRIATIDDARQLLEVIENADAYDSVVFQLEEIDLREERIVKWMEDNKDFMTIFVAEEDGDIIGYLQLKRGVIHSTKHCGTIAIGVHSKARGSGVGTKLFEHMHEWARANQLHRLELMVLTNNVKAIFLFRKMGYKIEGTKQDAMWIDGRYIDEYSMTRFIDEE
ncbi:GNAT family N-acetyltransferase [Kurthia huakuii]|uniref:GNAT family N-acetyltransferase n=1 Tax=Kurthia huakuii TaxID=1421019 RepID=UPI000497F4BA|nr:GNAT family N-acetyltransferase [Kurthia huakuii]MBM7698740.1 RimJ/RimL family protein N-acetyltransferase [Kurthia huakuii]